MRRDYTYKELTDKLYETKKLLRKNNDLNSQLAIDNLNFVIYFLKFKSNI